MSVQDLRKSDMMAHLLDALDAGKDIGHYGRLAFTMVARHFVSPDELLQLLRKNAGFSEEEARSLIKQVQTRDCNPPRRERILEWQRQQEFPICPFPEDPTGCNVYKDLEFPEEVYRKISDFYEDLAEPEIAEKKD
jgi:hypothetical protein